VAQTDTELVAGAGGGDRAAFQLLYERHWTAVYRFAWLLTGSVADAEDITQECFLALLRKSASFDPAKGQLRTWLIGMVRKQHLYRRRGREREAGNEPMEGAAPAGFDEELIRMERAEAVRRAMAALPESQRETLYLFEFEGLSLAEVAVVLEIEPNAVKARLFRARDRLKRLLQPSLRKEDAHGK
jgi:RNA polymerase sigma-70 factor (ECF subfamily)